MKTKIPPISEVRARLEPLSQSEMRELADVSSVPFTTLLKIRSGVTKNPGIETVRSFAEHIKRQKRQVAQPNQQIPV